VEVPKNPAAVALGKIKSEKKTLANRAKANLPPKEGKRQRGRPSKTQPTQVAADGDNVAQK
jgi:hypothetical protein